MNFSRTSMAVAGAAVIGFGVAAVPAVAKDRGADRGAKAGKAGKAGKSGKAFRARGLRSCNIATDQMLTPETHAGLARLKERLDERVADEKITQERADRVMLRRSTKVTVKVATRTAKWAPVFDLLSIEGDTLKAQKTALRTARKDAGGMRALLEAKGKTVADLRTARKAGRTAARTARADLCTSGAPATEETAATT